MSVREKKEEDMQEMKIIRMEDINTVKVRWLLYPYIPFGKITIVQGNPGEGKTTMMLAVIAAISKGEELNCGREALTAPATDFISGTAQPLTSIYQSAEDGLADTVKPRLEMLGADCSHVRVIDDTEHPLTMLDERIEAAIRETGASLLVLDPIQGYLGSAVNMNQSNEIRPVMKKLGQVAERTGCAVVLIGHMNKCFGSGNAVYRLLGSIDFTAAARSVILVGRDREDPEQRYAVQVKSSLAAEAPALGFRFDGGHFLWTGESGMTADGLLAGDVPCAYDSRPKQNAAYDFIRGYLEEHGGMVPATVLFDASDRAGLSRKTVYRMRQNHGTEIFVEKQGTRSVWHL